MFVAIVGAVCVVRGVGVRGVCVCGTCCDCDVWLCGCGLVSDV